ncbi:hypothetical protein D9M71_422010 [compost metagenome]
MITNFISQRKWQTPFEHFLINEIESPSEHQSEFVHSWAKISSSLQLFSEPTTGKQRVVVI